MRRSLQLAAITLALCAVVSAPAHAGLFGSSGPATINVQAGTPQSALATAWKVAGSRATVAPGSRVVVSGYRVVIINEASGRGSSRPGLGNQNQSTAAVNAYYTLHGLDNDALSAMGEQALTQLESELRARGYQVLDRNQLRSAGDVSRLTDPGIGNVQLLTVQNGDSAGYMYTPRDMLIKLPMGGKGKDPNGKDIAGAIATGGQVTQVAAMTGKLGRFGGSLGRLGGLAGQASGLAKLASGITSTMDAAGDSQAQTALAKALNATLLDVTFTLTFAEIEGSGGGFLNKIAGSDTAKVSATFAPVFVPTDTRIEVRRPDSGNAILLNNPVEAQGPAIAGVRNVTTGGDIAANVTGAVVSGLIALGTGGGMHTSMTVRRAVDAAPQYPQVVGDAISVMNKSVVDQIAR